jgi:hypothetical protein
MISQWRKFVENNEKRENAGEYAETKCNARTPFFTVERRPKCFAHGIELGYDSQNE